MTVLKFQKNQRMDGYYGLATFAKVGDEKELSDEVANTLLKKFPDMFVVVEKPVDNRGFLPMGGKQGPSLETIITTQPQTMSCIADKMGLPSHHGLLYPLKSLVDDGIVTKGKLNNRNVYFYKEEE